MRLATKKKFNMRDDINNKNPHVKVCIIISRIGVLMAESGIFVNNFNPGKFSNHATLVSPSIPDEPMLLMTRLFKISDREISSKSLLSFVQVSSQFNDASRTPSVFPS